MLRYLIILAILCTPGMTMADDAPAKAPASAPVSAPDRAVNTHIPFYDPADKLKSCVQLDDEISILDFKARVTEPGFLDNKWNKLAGMVALVYPKAYLVWIYTEAKRFGIEDRIAALNSRINVLRRVKAKKRCFEY